MATIGALIDRIKREWLTPPHEADVRTRLSADITATATTVTYNTALLTPDEEAMLGPGSIIEIGRELMLVTEYAAGSLTVVRGLDGTTATAHTAGATITINPLFPRQQIFDAVSDAIADLSPSLYTVKTEASVSPSATTYTELPADCLQPIAYRYLHAGGWYTGPVQFFNNFHDSSTKKAAFFPGVPDGASGHLVYQAAPSRPTAESDTLAALGVDEAWQRLIAVDVVLQFVSMMDLDALDMTSLAEQIQSQVAPPGTGSELRNQLSRYYEYLMTRARRRLMNENGLPTLVNGVTVG